ncbi:hypothetical protein ACT80S_06480 [Ramlibacter sp. MAHUQ-53]|uniref:hypothetical protein n=1 Tax=unclassified Ramlibacter TaxID=2617605 RepID=UPI0036323D48
MSHINTASLIRDISNDDLCELATESQGNTAQTVDALIEGVLARCGHALDDAAHAALIAIQRLHVPQLQDAFDELEALRHAA